jgi:hypothetical protein
MTAEFDIMQRKINGVLQNSETSIKKAVHDFHTLTSNIEDRIIRNGEKDNFLGFNINNQSGMLNIIHSSWNDSVDKLIKPDFHIETVHANALNQITDKFGIKGQVVQDYLKGPDWAKDLGVHILNEHSRHNTQRYLMRSVNGELRGFLSDRYKRFDSGKIVAQFLVSGHKAGLVPVSSNVGDTKLYFESIIPQVFAIQTEKNGILYVVFGAQISISDFGNGAMRVARFMKLVVCMNGMTRDTIIRHIHLGKEIDENNAASERTLMLETLARVSAVQDIMDNQFSREALIKETNAIQLSAATVIPNPEQEVKALQAKGMLKNEIKLLENYLMNNRIEDGMFGELTIWKLSQAIGAVARDVDESRKRELWDIAGSIFAKAV